MRGISKAAMLVLSLWAAQDVGAEDVDRGRLLADAMKVSQSIGDALSVCREMASSRDVEKDVAETPHLLGGIMPTDEDWPEAKALYLDMLRAGCAYDHEASEQVYADTLGSSLSAEDIDALLAFYRSDLGGRFLDATLDANNASNRAAKQLPEAETAYETFAEALQLLLGQRDAPVVPDEEPHVIKALASMDDAMAMSDRMMKGIQAGSVRGALALGAPHSAVKAERIEGLAQQYEEQASVRDGRYGASIDYELFRNDTIGDSLIRAVFLHRFEKHGVVWQFVWYRGKDGWVLSDMRYADDLTSLFR